jgi:ATP-dependent protease ClpP protease subunit
VRDCDDLHGIISRASPSTPVSRSRRFLETWSANYFLTAAEAKEYGLIDRVLARRFESDARPAV